MKVLALEPYYGGSHKAFLDSLVANSRHNWTLMTLPPFKWKWRMRHSALTFSQKLQNSKDRYDLIFCSDMLNLAEFKGLLPAHFRDLPTVVYFHENQLTYPVQTQDLRDYEYVLSNATAALAANAVWFNSAWHRDSFLTELTSFYKKMPDYQPVDVVEEIRSKSSVHHPGIESMPKRPPRKPGPLRILWAARWEHDKNPEAFFAAVKILKENNIDFKLNVIGEQFRDQPQVFNWARDFFTENINRYGYQPIRKDYLDTLLESDVVVSTANHEFFGIGVLEAVAAGCYPLLPKRLAYPEILDLAQSPAAQKYFYNENELAEKLQNLAHTIKTSDLDTQYAKSQANLFSWPTIAKNIDDQLALL